MKTLIKKGKRLYYGLQVSLLDFNQSILDSVVMRNFISADAWTENFHIYLQKKSLLNKKLEGLV